MQNSYNILSYSFKTWYCNCCLLLFKSGKVYITYCMLCLGECVNDAILFNNCITLIDLKQPNFAMLQNGL